jgi:hypothetical protein
MGQRLLGRRLRRQAKKGKIRPKTMQRALNTMRIDPRPPPEIPVKPVTIKQGGSVESYQDQVMRKFVGGQIKKMVAGRRVASAGTFNRPHTPPTTVTKQPKKKRGYGKATEGKPTLSKGGKIKAKKK